ncbi:DUF1266 domain-containing protein [Streptomyces sp. HU2014]|uniref:DUF1266 domain-containing protein n=1 Tax=Streptomyces sp. HU2014 TaxID=2939414 RepID=UPI002010276C|nr:DUF1266 domain-containing protein [Streptomyces sp. HU2014]UQI43747.1 DUF1266 domain-containing protein [Streptomyces sp. HU2014]
MTSTSPRTRALAARRPWQPPTEVERRLRDAALAGDEKGYLRVLAETDLYLYLAKDQVDAGGARSWRTTEDELGNWCVAVRTPGERPPRHAGSVASCRTLEDLAEHWPDARFSLYVNPGSPSGMRLRARPWDRRRWKKAARAAGTDRPTTLLTKLTGPRSGPLAHALACGAHLSVTNGVLWNEIGDVYRDYERDVHLLRDIWGTGTPQEWQLQMNALLAARNSPPEPELALRVRRELSRDAATLGADAWRRACAAALDELEIPEADAAVQDVIGRILRYEARFRADGLLAPDGYVRSAVGYDYGRAVGFARWGLSARLCPAEAAEGAILRAGGACREAYDSWEDFSAGYALGRVLRFDTEEFGEWYTAVLEPHRLLTTDPGSPWRTVGWDEAQGGNPGARIR